MTTNSYADISLFYGPTARISSDNRVASNMSWYTVSGPGFFGSDPAGFFSDIDTINADFVLIGASKVFATPTSTDDLALSGMTTFLDESFASMGFISGTYVYKFSNNETFTVEISAVPLPATIWLLGSVIAVGGLLLSRKPNCATA